MGGELMRCPKYWLKCAEEFRTAVNSFSHPQNRDSLRQVVENLEELARRAQQIIDAEQARERRRLEARKVEYVVDQRAIMSQLCHRMN
jgi:hypothetical protein